VSENTIFLTERFGPACEVQFSDWLAASVEDVQARAGTNGRCSEAECGKRRCVDSKVIAGFKVGLRRERDGGKKAFS
jgi:hypothetical protein